MDKETEDYFDGQFSMFTTRGWQDFIAQVTDMQQVYDKISNVDTPERMYFKKGQIDILSWVKEWQDTVTQTFKTLQDDTQAV